MADPDETGAGGEARRILPAPESAGERRSFDAAWERDFAAPLRGSTGPAAQSGTAGQGARGGTPAIPNTGRRSAPRLRVSLPARLISIEGNQPCVLMNLSRSGAQVAVLDAIRVGEGAVLRCGSLEVFGDVIRSDFGLNALRFEEELTDAQVLDIRHYYETFEERERRSLIDTARKWVTGDSDDDRPI